MRDPELKCFDEEQCVSLKWVTRACVMALVGVLLTAVAIYAHEMNARFVNLDTAACGRTLLWCQYVLFGICAALFLPGDMAGLWPRIGIWAAIQVGSAWYLAFIAAVMSSMNDGIGMLVVWFAPVYTLPSFLLALIPAFALRRAVSIRGCLVARSLCLVILLSITSSLICSYCNAIRRYWRAEQMRSESFNNWGKW